MVYAPGTCVGGVVLRAWRDGDDDVRALFVVDTVHVEKDYAIVDAELRALACGKSDGVLCALRADVEYDAVGFKDVQRAREFGRSALNGAVGRVCLKLAGLVRLEIVREGS